MNIDEIGKMFNIEINEETHTDYEEPTPGYECPGEYYGCCDKHII
ncbi:hypothetical protein EUTSA_v100007051mg, partial [Eutrema salsugineum]